MDKMNITITGASLSSENKGINALTLGTIISIIKNNPKAHIALFNQNSIEDSEKIHILTIEGENYEIIENYIWSSKYILCGILHMIFFFLPINLKKFLFIDHLYIFYTIPVLLNKKWGNKNIYNSSPRLRNLIKSDFVINLAEGDSFSDIYGIHVFLRHSLDKLLSIIYKRPLILFPQTIGPFKSIYGKHIARKILKNADKIFIREDESKRHLLELFGNLPNMEEANDMAFLMEPEKIVDKNFEEFIKNGIPIGVNVSGFLYDVQLGKEKVLGPNIDYTQLTNLIIQTVLNLDDRIKVIFFSHVGSEDFPVSERILSYYSQKGYKDRLFLLNKDYSAPQIKYLLSKLEFFTGARMHSCIGALSTGVPTVPQAYSYKFKGIMKKLYLDKYVIDLKIDTTETIKNKIIEAYSNKNDIRNKLLKIIPEIKKDSEKCGKLLHYIKI